MNFEPMSDDIPSQNGYHHPSALVTVLLKRDSENVVCCAYTQQLPDVIQSDVALHLQVH